MTTEATALVSARHEPEHVRLGLSDQQLLEMYTTMVLARALDERQWILNRQGKQAFVISCQGHEAVGVGTAWALERGRDVMIPYYRDLAAVLAFGMTARDILLAALARRDDPATGGRQMPSHFAHAAKKIITSSSPVATQICHAAGTALASKIRRDGAVSITYFGEGATSKGDFHEGINFAAIHKLPAIFVCENNSYAISVPVWKQMAVANVADRAPGYGIPGVVVDGTDVLAVYRATKAAVERARRGEGPTLIEAKVFRLTPHSSDDDDRRYRSREEVEEARRTRDPILRCRLYLEEQGILDEQREAEIRRRVQAEVEEALAFAESSPLPEPESAFRHVYKGITTENPLARWR